MKVDFTLDQFRDLWHGSSREDSFSYDGLEHLYNHLDEHYPDSPYNDDLVALDSDYIEFDDIFDLLENITTSKVQELTNGYVVDDTYYEDEDAIFEDLESIDSDACDAIITEFDGRFLCWNR